MFGNNMMKKLQEMQAQMEEIKERLNHIKLIGEAEGGVVRVEVNGNGVITDIEIRAELPDDKKIELIQLAANRALEQSYNTREAEMAQSAKGMMPGLGMCLRQAQPPNNLTGLNNHFMEKALYLHL